MTGSLGFGITASLLRSGREEVRGGIRGRIVFGGSFLLKVLTLTVGANLTVPALTDPAALVIDIITIIIAPAFKLRMLFLHFA
jgi:hypothetical protein